MGIWLIGHEYMETVKQNPKFECFNPGLKPSWKRFPVFFLIIFVIFATEETWFASNFHIDMVLCEH